MRKKNKKALSVFLSFIILFPLLSNILLFTEEVVFATSSKNEITIVNGKEFVNGQRNTCNFNSKNVVPSNVYICNEKNYPLNYDLFVEKQLVVYGDWKLINPNPFTPGTQRNGQVYKNEGNFTKNGVKGEYRYLGAQYNGSSFSNPFFINDKTTNKAREDKNWIYKPWVELPSSYAHGTKNAGSYYDGSLDVTNPLYAGIKSNLERATGINSVDHGVTWANRHKGTTGNVTEPTDIRNYSVVFNEPTVHSVGAARLYHYSKTSNKIWYETFTMPVLAQNEKKQVPNSCKIEVVDKQPVNNMGTGKIAINVKVTATLEDNGKDNSYYYTHEDIKEWQFTSLTETKGSAVQKVKPNGNKAVYQYTVYIDTTMQQATNEKGIYTANLGARVQAIYANEKNNELSRSSEESCNIDVKIKSPIGNTGHQSEFIVNPEIHFINRSEFTQSRVGYEDGSVGEGIDFYTLTITNIDTNAKATKQFNPANPKTLKSSDVEKFLHEFMKNEFSETTDERVVKHYRITQAVTDNDAKANKTSEATRQITVVQNSKEFITVGNVCSPELLASYPKVPQFVTPQTDWPLHWWDQIPLPVTDSPPPYIPGQMCEDAPGYDEFTKRVFIEGKEVDADEFYDGNYEFGEDNIGLKLIEVQITAPDGTVSFKKQWIVVHAAKPNVSLAIEGNYKENRTMIARDTSSSSNDAWAEEQAPLNVTSFSYVNPNDPELVYEAGYGEDNLSEKKFMYKGVGEKYLSIAAERTIRYGAGKSKTFYSDPYEVRYRIIEDHKPITILHNYGNQVSRIDAFDMYYENASLDGDYVKETKLEVYYDSEHNDTFKTKVFETTNVVQELPVFTKLGQYKIVAYAKEDTTEPRLMQFINPEDYRTQVTESYFYVDNYSPATDIYLDKPYEMPKIDVYFILDANLNTDASKYIKDNHVGITNLFTQSNILANIGIWDQRTYTYYQDTSTARSTGTSYPSSTIPFSTDEGYSGTLTRFDVSNSPYQVDMGQYVTVVDSMTATNSCTNTVTTSFDKYGGIASQTSTSVCPGSYPAPDGWSGSLSRTGESSSGSCPATPNTTCSSTWTASYSGTVTKEREEWVPNMVWRDSYTGYYKGTLSKDIRQTNNTSFISDVKDKYVVYISDNTITDLHDLQYVMNKQSANLILAGKNAMTSQISHEKFIVNNSTIQGLVGNIISYIAESNPAIPKVYRLIDEKIEFNKAEFDYENDPMPSQFEQIQFLHDPKFFDNDSGYERYGGKTLIGEQNANNWHSYTNNVTFTKTGKYTIIRRNKDLPSTDPKLADYSYQSNEAKIEVMVHRKPIADLILDFDFETSSNTYRTKWIDVSYDLDHNITRANSDRGIVDSAIKFTHIESGEVFTSIPTHLVPGNYKIEYIVKDIEGEWSDPFIKTYNLPNAVPVQFKSKLKTEYNGFSLNSVPASEKLVAYELWTRYPYSVRLDFSMGSYINRTVPYYTGTKTGNDISWNNETLTIGETVPDGDYVFKITANGAVDNSKTTHDYTVKVRTPINLKGQVDSDRTTNVSSIVKGDPYFIKGNTTKYANSVVVTLYKGTGYQRNVTLTSSTTNTTGYGNKNWNFDLTVPSNIPNGTYTFEWTARTPNGNVETVSKQYLIEDNKPPISSFVCKPNPAYEGDTINCTNTSVDPDGDAMTYQWTVTGPNGYSKSYTTTDIVIPSTVTENGIGNYNVVLRATDVRGKVNDNDARETVVVLPLKIDGAVTHTDEWEKNRQTWNSGNPSDQRGVDVFFAGEGFVLTGIPTVTSNSGGSTTVATRVDVTANLIGSTGLAKQTAAKWTGYLGQENASVELEKLADGAYDFVFTVTYSNGVKKTDTVRIYIRDNWTTYHQFHKQF